MAKVADSSTGLQFKKPVGTTPPLSAYDPAYVARKAEFTERFFELKSGRKICYITDGSPSDPAVLCFPTLNGAKWQYIFPKPLPGVYVIAVDRMGHGKSSELAGKEEWKP